MLLALAGWAGQRNVNVDVVPLVAKEEQSCHLPAMQSRCLSSTN